MKIAYIVPALSNKGPIIVVKELVSQFIKNNHYCVVYYLDDIIELDFDCPVIKINKEEKINFDKYDIVHSHGLRPDIYIFKNKSKKRSNTLFVSTLHNYVFQDLKYQYNSLISVIFGFLWMYCLKKHDKIVTLSKDAQKYYSKWFHSNKLSYVYNTRNLDVSKKLNDKELNELISFKLDSTLIGVSALLTHRKGVDILIKALPYLENYKLFIVGDGKSRKKLEKLTSELNVSNRCFFVGYKLDAYRYLEHFDIFAMPSRSEGFPISLLEASIYSKPVVASNLSVIEEAFSNNEISFFNLKKPLTIVDSIKELTNNNEKGKNLNTKYLDFYSPEKMYKRYLSIYNREI